MAGCSHCPSPLGCARLRPDSARLSRPLCSHLPASSAHLSSPLPVSLPSIPVRFVFLAHTQNPGADAPSEAGGRAVCQCRIVFDGSILNFWCRCRWLTFTKTHSLRNYGYEKGVGVLSSLMANCTALPLSLPLWSVPASGLLVPASTGPCAHLFPPLLHIIPLRCVSLVK